MKIKITEVLEQCNAKELADFLGVSTQAVSQFKNGKAMPKVENVLKIAEFCNVSLDYLFGVSPVKSTDATIQQVAKATRLSERAAQMLLRLSNRDVSIVSKIIETFEVVEGESDNGQTDGS